MGYADMCPRNLGTWLPTTPRELQPGAKIQPWALPLFLPNLLPQQPPEELHTGKGRETEKETQLWLHVLPHRVLHHVPAPVTPGTEGNWERELFMVMLAGLNLFW